jgi:hypothetical protein
MKRSRFTESQIVEIVQEADARLSANEVWREHAISSARYYIYGRLPLARRIGFSERLIDCQHLCGVINRMVRPNGISAHTLLDKWPASMAIIKGRI